MKKRLLLFIGLLLLSSWSVLAQTEVIDLAKKVKAKTINVKPDRTFNIKIKNMIPAPNGGTPVYNVKIEKKYHAPEPFPTQTFDAIAPADITGFVSTDPACTKLVKATNDLQNSDSEGKVKSNKKNLKEEIDKVGVGCIGLVAKANELIDATTMILADNILSKGEYLELIISRADGEDEISWIFTFDTGKKGQWITSYGFSFASHTFSNEGAYYLSQQDMMDMDGNVISSEFRITEEEDRKGLDFIPSVMFSYIKNNNNKDWKWSLTGGLGVDTNKPTVFLGISAFYHYNLGISVGLIAHPQKQLLGKYEEGEILSELIETDQLHYEPYRINPFFSVSFRFAENPFTRNEE